MAKKRLTANQKAYQKEYKLAERRIKDAVRRAKKQGFTVNVTASDFIPALKSKSGRITKQDIQNLKNVKGSVINQYAIKTSSQGNSITRAQEVQRQREIAGEKGRRTQLAKRLVSKNKVLLPEKFGGIEMPSSEVIVNTNIFGEGMTPEDFYSMINGQEYTGDIDFVTEGKIEAGNAASTMEGFDLLQHEIVNLCKKYGDVVVAEAIVQMEADGIDVGNAVKYNERQALIWLELLGARLNLGSDEMDRMSDRLTDLEMQHAANQNLKGDY